jgi:hypothetical protein
MIDIVCMCVCVAVVHVCAHTLSCMCHKKGVQEGSEAGRLALSGPAAGSHTLHVDKCVHPTTRDQEQRPTPSPFLTVWVLNHSHPQAPTKG